MPYPFEKTAQLCLLDAKLFLVRGMLLGAYRPLVHQRTRGNNAMRRGAKDLHQFRIDVSLMAPRHRCPHLLSNEHTGNEVNAALVPRHAFPSVANIHNF